MTQFVNQTVTPWVWGEGELVSVISMQDHLRLVMTPHCNLPQDQIVLKCLKLISTPCVHYGLFGKMNVSRSPRWAAEHAGEYLSVAGGAGQ
jgi:hypothetical protein